MSIPVADAIFWIAVACCSVAQLAIIRSVVAAPATSADSRAHRVVEIAWAVLPGVALVFVLVATWRAMHPVLPVIG
jgi:hypothetical protein